MTTLPHRSLGLAKITCSTALAAMLGLAAAFIFFYTLGGLVGEARHADFLVLLVPMPLAAILLSWQVTRRYVLRRLRAQL